MSDETLIRPPAAQPPAPPPAPRSDSLIRPSTPKSDYDDSLIRPGGPARRTEDTLIRPRPDATAPGRPRIAVDARRTAFAPYCVGATWQPLIQGEDTSGGRIALAKPPVVEAYPPKGKSSTPEVKVIPGGHEVVVSLDQPGEWHLLIRTDHDVVTPAIYVHPLPR